MLAWIRVHRHLFFIAVMFSIIALVFFSFAVTWYFQGTSTPIAPKPTPHILPSQALIMGEIRNDDLRAAPTFAEVFAKFQENLTANLMENFTAQFAAMNASLASQLSANLTAQLTAMNTSFNSQFASVNTTIASVNTTLASVNNSIASVNTTIASVNASIASVNASIASVNASVVSVNASVNSNIDGVNATLSAQIAHVNTSLFEEMLRTKGTVAWELAEGSRLAVSWHHPNGTFDAGCGAYVTMHNKCFAVTNRHVIAKYYNEPSVVVGLRLGDSTTLTPIGDVYFYGRGDPDLAIWEVVCLGASAPDHIPIELWPGKVPVGTDLRAISSALRNRTAIRCTWKAEGSVGAAIADCPGGYGFSGTAFLDEWGRAVGFYKGAPMAGIFGNFGGPDFGDITVEEWLLIGDSDDHALLPPLSREELWKKIKELCQPGYSTATLPPETFNVRRRNQKPTATARSPTEMHESCFQALERVITVTNVMQTTTLVPASFVLSLYRDHNLTGLQNITFTRP
jgi:hypothetical protein